MLAAQEHQLALTAANAQVELLKADNARLEGKIQGMTEGMAMRFV